MVDRHVVRHGSFGVKQKVKKPSARYYALWIAVLLVGSLKKIRRLKGYCQSHPEFIRGSLPGHWSPSWLPKYTLNIPETNS